MVKTELEKIRQSGHIDIQREYNKAMIQATKNSIMNFMKKQLKMDEKSRNAVKIIEIYPSQGENNIIYIKCKSQDDIAMITASARNLPRTNYDEEPPTLVPYVPKELYTRYQDLEKLMWQIRKTELGKISTNIRLGRLDYLIRYKSKQDPTNWKDIAPMNIPANIADPEINDKYFNDINEDDQNQEMEEDENPASRHDLNLPPIMILDEHDQHDQQKDLDSYNSQYTTFSLSPTNKEGTMLNELRNQTKHKLSPEIINKETTKKAKTFPETKQNNDEEQKTSEQINEEARIIDNEIKQRTEETLEKILNKVNNHISMQQIKITKSETKVTTKEDQSKQHHG